MTRPRGLGEAGASPLKWLDQRSSGKRLGEIGDTTGCHGGHAGGLIVFSRDVNDRQANAGRLQPMAHLNAGVIVEIDVKNGANGLLIITVFLKSVGRRK